MNINNVIKYMKSYFIEVESRNYLTYVIAFALALFLNNSMANEAFIGLWTAFAMSQMSYLFGKLSVNSGRISYLMLPVSTTEKMVASALIIYVYCNAAIPLSLFLGSAVRLTFNHYFLQSAMNVAQPIIWQLPYHATDIAMVFLIESIMMFCMIYFKKSPVRNTILVLVAMCLILVVVAAAVISPVLMAMKNINPEDATCWFTYKWVFMLIVAFFFVFNNFMSWLRLRETEA